MMKIPDWWNSETHWHMIDCIEGMAEIPDESVDMILSDYPFNCQDDRKDYVGFVALTVEAYNRILKDGGNLVVVQNPSNMFKTAHFYLDFTFRNSIALLRQTALRCAWHLGFKHNWAWLLCKGDVRKKWNGATKNHDKSSDVDVMEYQNGYVCSHGVAPQALPLDLVELLIRLNSDEGDIVLDPFLHSGTTLEACRNLKRIGLGFEIKIQYEPMIRHRYRSAARAGKKLEDVF